MWSLPIGKLRWCFESFWQPKSSPERGGMWSLPLRRLRRCPRLMPACCGDPWLPLARLAAPWHAPWQGPSSCGQAPPQQPTTRKPSPHHHPSQHLPRGHPRTQTHGSPKSHTLSHTTPTTPTRSSNFRVPKSLKVPTLSSPTFPTSSSPKTRRRQRFSASGSPADH